MEELLPFIDIAICSDDFRPPGCRDEKDVLEFLDGRGIRRVAITRGAAAICFADHHKRGAISWKRLGRWIRLAPAISFMAPSAITFAWAQTFARFSAAAARVATFSCRYLGTRSWMKNFPRE